MHIPTLLTQAPSLSDSARSRVAVRVAAVVGFALATALSAQLVLPLPHTPVPITLQTFVVPLAAMSMGPLYGALSMAFYLLLGATGYAVFHAGESALFGATSGYLLGFLLAQPLVGYLTRGIESAPSLVKWRRLLAGVIAANLVIFACGVTWLALWLSVDLDGALSMGFWPFVPGSFLKGAMTLTAAGVFAPGLRRRIL